MMLSFAIFFLITCLAKSRRYWPVVFSFHFAHLIDFLIITSFPLFSLFISSNKVEFFPFIFY
ncbi:hypothetical protein BDC45DRAFT_497968 [Circinella umbellata]|nr:hypothetical protein BDC45DRAFT_497968 [Circinella umbellata]